MEGGSLLSVQGLGDKHVAADGVYVVDPTWGLISAGSGDAVADANVLVLIRADLKTEPEKEEKNLSFSAGFCNRKHKMIRAKIVTL